MDALLLAMALLPAGPGAVSASSAPTHAQYRAVFPSIELNARAHAVRIPARVVLREGPLELFICRTGTKEHESILATDVEPRLLAAALVMAGAVRGTPCRFDPFRPPTGTSVAIGMAWRQNGRPMHASPRTWVRHVRTRRPLDLDWVFVGSRVETIPETGEKRFLADDGDLVTLANFYAPLLDLPLRSTASDADLLFEANRDAIPPLGTRVTVTFRVKVASASSTPTTRPSRATQPPGRAR